MEQTIGQISHTFNIPNQTLRNLATRLRKQRGSFGRLEAKSSTAYYSPAEVAELVELSKRRPGRPAKTRIKTDCETV